MTHPDTGYLIREVVRCIQGGKGAVVRELISFAEREITDAESAISAEQMLKLQRKD